MQPKSPLHFCVVTPTHNRHEYLPEAVASVQANIKVPIDFTFEHLICENGCNDGTHDWLVETSKKYNNIRFWSEPIKLLPGPARNVVIKEAPKDSWIVPLDDDDVMLQRNLHYYADIILNNPDKEWIVNDFLRMDQERRYMISEDYYTWKFESNVEMLKAIFKGDCFIQGNVCYSKKIFDEVGGYHESLRMAEDLDLYVRFLIAGYQPIPSKHVGHLHRFHTGNVSIGVDKEKHHKDLETIYERYEEQLQKLEVKMPKME